MPTVCGVRCLACAQSGDVKRLHSPERQPAQKNKYHSNMSQ